MRRGEVRNLGPIAGTGAGGGIPGTGAADLGRYAVAAVDVATCQTLWRITQPGRHRIEQLGAALVDVSPNELVSLPAP